MSVLQYSHKIPFMSFVKLLNNYMIYKSDDKKEECLKRICGYWPNHDITVEELHKLTLDIVSDFRYSINQKEDIIEEIESDLLKIMVVEVTHQ